MPELPEVETVVQTLTPTVLKQTIASVKLYDTAIIRYNDPQDFISRLEGKQILELSRRGKFLLFLLGGNAEPQEWLIVHLNMTGALIERAPEGYGGYPPSLSNHVHLEFELSNGKVIFYSDYRRFGSLRVVSLPDLSNPTIKHLSCLQTMGPEPFDSEVDVLVRKTLSARKYHQRTIKEVLLDQKVIAGVGNIYANECLFLAGISPWVLVEDLYVEDLQVILASLRQVLSEAISFGGTSIRDFVNGQGKSGQFQNHLKVYNQLVCPSCQGSILKTRIDTRATFYCPECQGSHVKLPS